MAFVCFVSYRTDNIVLSELRELDVDEILEHELGETVIESEWFPYENKMVNREYLIRE